MHLDDLKTLALSLGLKSSALGDLELAFEAYDDNGKQSAQTFITNWLRERPHCVQREPDVDVATKLLTNLSAQADLVKEVGVDEAKAQIERLGGKLGLITKAKAADTEPDPKSSSNPWHKNYRGDAEAKRVELIKSLGTAKAAALAKAAGVDIAGRPLAKR